MWPKRRPCGVMGPEAMGDTAQREHQSHGPRGWGGKNLARPPHMRGSVTVMHFMCTCTPEGVEIRRNLKLDGTWQGGNGNMVIIVSVGDSLCFPLKWLATRLFRKLPLLLSPSGGFWHYGQFLFFLCILFLRLLFHTDTRNQLHSIYRIMVGCSRRAVFLVRSKSSFL